LLRAWGDGESNQGTTIGVVRGSDFDPLSEVESSGVASLQRGLRLDERDAELGFGRNRDGAGAVRDDSVEAAQDRRASASHSAPRGGATGEQLSVSGIVSSDLSQVAGNGATASLRRGRIGSHNPTLV